MRLVFQTISIAVMLAGCAEHATLPLQATTGPNPELVAPLQSALPTVNIAPAKGWPEGGAPHAASGYRVGAFAKNLQHPRWLYVLPNGDVLVAETAAPPQPEEGKGLKGQVMKQVMKRAGSAVPSANRITLLRDADHDGIAETAIPFLTNLNSPFGMALVGDYLYVANTDAVLKFRYVSGQTKISEPAEKLADLPAGPRNHHWTKNLVASHDGKRLYATVGSNSNAGEHGIEQEADRAAILEIDIATGRTRVFASGMRNPNGMGWESESGLLWTVVNERDELGSDLVPDYLTSVKEGAFYGWPWSYYGSHVDRRVQPERPDMVAKAIAPDYALGAHVAPLGLAFHRGGAYIANHGSWNRRPPSGYDVVFVPFSHGKPYGQPQVVLDGFLDEEGNALGRPVGVAVDGPGALLVADDVGNAVWRVTTSSK